MEGSPRIRDGGVPFQRALDAFALKSRGGRGGAVVQLCSCQSRKGVGLGLDGIQNRQVAMATFPDTPKQEMPLCLPCLGRGPERAGGAEVSHCSHLTDLKGLSVWRTVRPPHY